MPRNLPKKPPVVVAFAFDGISPFHLAVPCLVFGEDRSALGLPRFDFRVFALGTAPLRTEAGFTLAVEHGLEAMADADIVVIPSWKELDRLPPDDFVEALRAAHERGAVIVGLCLGTFALAGAGLLAGRSATTHWAYADQLAMQYPDIHVDPDVLYVDHGDVVTSAGVAAGLDCCLHIVRARFGAEAAFRLARRIVLSPHRAGGQAQFIERPVSDAPVADRFMRALDQVRADLGGDHSIDGLARATGLTRRTFTRRFQKLFGTSFGDWLAARRTEEARRLLETTGKSIETIAFEVGFGSAASLRQHFATRLQTSPLQYRRAFAGPLPAA